MLTDGEVPCCQFLRATTQFIHASYLFNYLSGGVRSLFNYPENISQTAFIVACYGCEVVWPSVARLRLCGCGFVVCHFAGLNFCSTIYQRWKPKLAVKEGVLKRD